MELTTEEIEQLEMWVRHQSVVNMPVERPKSTTVGLVGTGDVEGYLGGGVRLSEATARAEEAILQKKIRHRESVAKRKAKLKRGQRHHNSKKATARRQKEKRWETNPLGCLMYGFGSWAITQEEWDTNIGFLWSMYKPADLTVKRAWGKGSRAQPYTIYDLKVVHSKYGVVYDGMDKFIYDHSKPTELDIEKAPEGALLFSVYRLSIRSLHRYWFNYYTLRKLQTA